MKYKRCSGVLLHPTSLSGSYGIGDLGPEAYHFVDFLAETGCTFWQVLPLGPTGYGDSPYQCFSAFAGNPYLVNPDLLLREGFLKDEDLEGKPDFSSDKVDYGLVIPWKLSMLDKAYYRFKDGSFPQLEVALTAFELEQEPWLNDFALFMTIKELQGDKAWCEWEPDLRARNPKALKKISKAHSEVIHRHIFRQFLFFRQWERLHTYAQKRGVYIIGDIPIFVAHDSADIWANRELFYLDEQGKPTVVAGVPPDYFSETGQLWGNPLYRWDVHAQTGYTWWLSRFTTVLSLVDIVRLDHFRGFAGYWEVTAGESTAKNGRWVPGPGSSFFEMVAGRLETGMSPLLGLAETWGTGLPIIAEDLGEITPDVIKLRDDFDLPGMKILVFAFDSGPTNPFLPHHYPQNCLVYTGTHDNDTVRGWYERVDEAERNFARRYLGSDGSNIAWDFVRTAWASRARIAIAPMQDLLGLGNEARMNYPGRSGGNWTWRMSAEALSPALGERLSELNLLFEREK
ncbi:MAG: 4-alpha-glucanotransferase [Chloroflexota bacterium]